MSKYDDWLAKKEIPAEMSIIELEVLARRLGIDVDAIREKHLGTLHDELWEVVKADGLTVQKS